MSEQIPAEKPAVIGEDGELVQPDTSVDPEAYSEYLATHVHRDPMLSVLRENIRENGCAYLLFSPLIVIPVLMLLALFVKWIQDLGSDFGQDVTVLVIGSIVLMLGIGLGYLFIEARRYYGS